MQKGDYVLATKYSDGDPGDAWCVGFYDRTEGDRIYVTDENGTQWRCNGYRKVGLITPEYGEWVLSISKELEASPPGSVNLWGMLGVTATPEDVND